MSINLIKGNFLGSFLTISKISIVIDKVNEIIKWLNGQDGSGSYKVYTALITQSGTSAPTVKILNNTIGNIVWTRFSQGRYRGTLTGKFTTDKTAFLLGHDDSSSLMSVYWVDVNTVEVDTADSTGTLQDNLLTDSTIEIRIYN